MRYCFTLHSLRSGGILPRESRKSRMDTRLLHLPFHKVAIVLALPRWSLTPASSKQDANRVTAGTFQKEKTNSKQAPVHCSNQTLDNTSLSPARQRSVQGVAGWMGALVCVQATKQAAACVSNAGSATDRNEVSRLGRAGRKCNTSR